MHLLESESKYQLYSKKEVTELVDVFLRVCICVCVFGSAVCGVDGGLKSKTRVMTRRGSETAAWVMLDVPGNNVTRRRRPSYLKTTFFTSPLNFPAHRRERHTSFDKTLFFILGVLV